MDWLKQLSVVALTVVVFLCVTACAQELGEGSGTVSQPASTPSVLSTPLSPQSTVRPTPREKGDEFWAFPCGPSPQELGFEVAHFSDLFLEWTPDGSQLMFSYGTAIWIVETAGSHMRMLVDANPSGEFYNGFSADISADGTQVVFSTCQYPWDTQSSGARPGSALLSLPAYSPDLYDIALIGIDGGVPERLTDNPFFDHFPAWSHDGKRIAYMAFKDEKTYAGKVIMTMAADGSELREVEGTRDLAIASAPLAWSPTEELLAYRLYDDQNWPTQFFLYTVRADGSGLQSIADNVVSEVSWSPDGQQIALARLVGKEIGLYTLTADGSDLKFLLAITDLEEYLAWTTEFRSYLNTLSWSPDGSRLLYSCHEVACVVDLKSGQSIGLVADNPNWYRQPFVAAWSPDGSRIAIYTPGYVFDDVPAQLFTVARDGTNRRDLIRMDDSNLVPANPPQETP